MPRVVVIGAGAAGTMAAIFAASSGVPTLLLERPRGGGRQILVSRRGRCNALPLQADAVIVATGGLSVPNTGSDGLGLRGAEELGHTVHPTYAALTPLIVTPPPFGDLAGVSLPVTLTARAGGRAATATGGFLFTHRGYSGPVVLDVSHIAVRSRAEKVPPARIAVRWTPLGVL